ncbi:hypothetical protein [Micromonospora sp. NBC_00860]|uniref:hypothetical protein n=1 Tax=Micromonospora sp. NBC_00860 TaxID=2975980 RepID=UPI00386F17B2|nr:hypothetical protein OH804_03390 [Micromonospora sp. NBC_00860]
MTPTTPLGHRPAARLAGEHLLPWHIAVEKARLLEYQRMRLLSEQEAADIGRLLHDAGRAVTITGAGTAPDVATALEQWARERLRDTPGRWHAGGGRTDVRACAEALFTRDRLARAGDCLVALGRSAVALARRTTHLPMAGPDRQLITPGFYFAAVADQVVRSGRRLLYTYDLGNTAALGAGDGNGQDPAFDRDRMARLLGCAAATPHALAAVASGSWILEPAGELATVAVAVSRYVTDLSAWGDAGYLDLPGEIAGVATDRPFPVLDQARVRTSHLIALATALSLSRRGVAFGAGAPAAVDHRLPELFDTFDGMIRLLTAVFDRLEFRADRMRAACEQGVDGDVDSALHRNLTGGSAHPDAVRALSTRQFSELGEISRGWSERAAVRRAGLAEADRLLGLGHLTP